MIVATREGEVIRTGELSQEQKESAWAMIFRSFCQQHPEVLKTGGQEAAEPGTGSV